MSHTPEDHLSIRAFRLLEGCFALIPLYRNPTMHTAPTSEYPALVLEFLLLFTFAVVCTPLALPQEPEEPDPFEDHEEIRRLSARLPK